MLLRRTLETTTAVPAWKATLEAWTPLLMNAIVLSMFITPLIIRHVPSLIHYGFRVARHCRLRSDGSGISCQAVGLEAPVDTVEGDGVPGSLTEEPAASPRVLIAGYGPSPSR